MNIARSADLYSRVQARRWLESMARESRFEAKGCTQYLGLRHAAVMIAATAALSAFVLPAFAQVAAPAVPGNILTTSDPIGTPPGVTAEGTNESINLSNGALTVYVPLLSVPQRGGWSLPFAYINSSDSYHLQSNISTIPTQLTQDGEPDMYTSTLNYSVGMVDDDQMFELNLPRLQASEEYAGDWDIMNGSTVMGVSERYCLMNFVFTDWEGNKHPFAITQSCNQPWEASAPYIASTIGDATDGSFYRIDLSNLSDVRVISKGGAIYHFGTLQVPFPDGPNDNPQQNDENWFDRRLASMTDTNGNTISVSESGPINDPVYAVTDTLGKLCAGS